MYTVRTCLFSCFWARKGRAVGTYTLKKSSVNSVINVTILILLHNFCYKSVTFSVTATDFAASIPVGIRAAET
jgi:hypothetical protein